MIFYRRVLSSLLVFSLASSLSMCNSSASSKKTYYQTIINQETQWIASLQLSNGSIPMVSYKNEPNTTISANPYFSDLSVLALFTKGMTYKKQIKRYLNWHFKHLNTKAQDIHHVAGTIYDYKEVANSSGKVLKESISIVNGKKFYDSTDSYAATFLSVLSNYNQKIGDHHYLKTHKKQIDLIFSALCSTYHKGLTYATPSYQVFYLMDNSEVYQGLSDAISLYSSLFKKDKRIQKMKAMRSAIKKRIAKMYLYPSKLYTSALSNTYKPYTTTWSVFYMDSVAQAYPTINSVDKASSKRSISLYQSLNKYWCQGKKNHDWSTLKTPDDYIRGDLVYFAAMEKDKTRVSSYMKAYRTLAKSTHHAYPLYNADIGFVVRAAALMKKLY